MKNYESLLSLKVLYVQILKNEIKLGWEKGLGMAYSTGVKE
jgi:hypothetical protein